ncbi:MAG TPA: hypothetical protein VGO41_06190, partial [Steroidobacteraceae bacterium]|nr:hypothetical protein [Steroidobacteraceae bacterium]
YRTRVTTFAASADALQTRSGLRIVPDQVAASWSADRLLPAVGGLPPANTLDQTLRDIGERYGKRTAGVVAMQLEYPFAASR